MQTMGSWRQLDSQRDVEVTAFGSALIPLAKSKALKLFPELSNFLFKFYITI